jgi:hypothetical protein
MPRKNQTPLHSLVAAPYIPLKRVTLCVLAFAAAFVCRLEGLRAGGSSPVGLPSPGDKELLVLTPEILQVGLVTGGSDWSKAAHPFPRLLGANDVPVLPPLDSWKISSRADAKPGVEVVRQGLWRMPVFAGYHEFDLRVEWRIFLEIKPALSPGDTVMLENNELFPPGTQLRAAASAERVNPVFHVSDFGFAPANPKFAFVSYHLGTLGEMEWAPPADASLLNAHGVEVLKVLPVLHSSPDWEFDQHVWRIDFSALREPGLYQLALPGLGRSQSFRIENDTLLIAPRLLAGALYVQRSGWTKSPPFTRYAHEASHTRPAAVPDASSDFRATNKHLAAMAGKNTDPKTQTAPLFQSVDDGLYPFVRRGEVDVSGGHYDAGDYSKYTINSAQLIHYLAFAVDHFPGVAGVDNLGISESGDGVPDALQIALHEVRFLLKMQDEDGGFYFLVYPRDRPYELDVLPERGDPQVVFPKNTASTAAAVGALAQLAASPVLKRHDAKLAAACKDAALRGYGFLRGAREKFGFEGSYQTISHYGNFSGHKDEWAYAMAALFALTGDKKFEQELMEVWPDPTSPETKRWGWWGLPESFGAAARVYAFCEKPGFLPEGSRDASYFARVESVIHETAGTWLDLSDADAFGVPFSRAAKRQKRAGWFWVMEPAVDVASAWLLRPETKFVARCQKALALWAGFEGGGNPLNQPYFTGIGRHWRRNAVNRITLNDDRKLAVPGIPIGNIVSTPHNLRPYQIEGRAALRGWFTPSLETFPFYERSGTDAYNVREEWTIATGGRLLAGHLFRLGQVEEAAGAPVGIREFSIEMSPENPRVGDRVRFQIREATQESGPDGGAEMPPGSPDHDAHAPLIIWEWIGREPATGRTAEFSIQKSGTQRLEVELLWPDGWRAAAVKEFVVPEP